MSVTSALYGMKSVIGSKLFVKLPIPEAGPGIHKQTFIVTGANGGLGFESSLHLSRLGVGKLIMGVRTLAKGEEAKKKIIEITGQSPSTIEVWPLDMDSYDSVKAFASRVVAELPRLDGVLANAGVMTTQWSLSEGHEKTLNVNVISTFLLYLLLLPKMRESGTRTGQISRFVIPNSALYNMAPLGELDPDQDLSIIKRLDDEKTANMSGRYPLSKLLVLFAVREFAKRSSATGKGDSIVNTPNPSFCKSNLAQESADSRAFKMFEKVMARSTNEGSRVLVHGLLAGSETNGQYMSNCQVET
ncbi:short-chain dehydrogenase [Apiospora rasikravindrae]|uniref:Short-chain dehydrogenase n=1 Tax=Apiospora rasikravindrae TaxID=990691 RepID=A0ABR1SZD1_9PEZI